MTNRTITAIKRLERSIREYDELKSEHAEKTRDLTEAKKRMDDCSRAVVEAENAGPTLFDEPAPTATSSTTVDGQDARVVSPASKDEKDNGEGEGDDVTLDGKTGAPIEEPKYELTPSEEDPTLCICGWEIRSPAPGHSARHQRYVSALEGGGAAAEPVAKPKRARSRRVTDMTAAVAAKAKGKRGARG